MQLPVVDVQRIQKLQKVLRSYERYEYAQPDVIDSVLAGGAVAGENFLALIDRLTDLDGESCEKLELLHVPDLAMRLIDEFLLKRRRHAFRIGNLS